MRNVRTLHLYLGCLFAPLLVLFTVSGAWQTFNLHESKKSGFQAPAIVKSLSAIHTDQRYEIDGDHRGHSVPFRWFVLFMSVGLLVSTLLGIFMAMKFTRNRSLVWACLLAGTLLPIFLLTFR